MKLNSRILKMVHSESQHLFLHISW